MKTFRFYKTADARAIHNDFITCVEIDACKIETAIKRLYKHEKYEADAWCITKVGEYEEKFVGCLSL